MAVVEAGLGGRLDATNVVDAEIVLLTNVSLEHTEVLGDTTEQIAKEKLAVAHAARIVVLPDNQYADLVPKSAEIVTGDARAAKSSSGARAKPSRVAFQGASSTAAASSGTAHTLRRHRVAA